MQKWQKLDYEKKSKIVSRLSDVIKIVVNDGVLNIEDAVAPLLDIIKMFTIEYGDMNNNKEVDIHDVLEVVNTSAPIKVELRT